MWWKFLTFLYIYIFHFPFTSSTFFYSHSHENLIKFTYFHTVGMEEKFSHDRLRSLRWKIVQQEKSNDADIFIDKFSTFSHILKMHFPMTSSIFHHIYPIFMWFSHKTFLFSHIFYPTPHTHTHLQPVEDQVSASCISFFIIFIPFMFYLYFIFIAFIFYPVFFILSPFSSHLLRIFFLYFNSCSLQRIIYDTLQSYPTYWRGNYSKRVVFFA